MMERLSFGLDELVRRRAALAERLREIEIRGDGGPEEERGLRIELRSLDRELAAMAGAA
ncbi:hypothetical protein [Falsiroseomonas sp. HW251]|uniref:hypothetical protein n=1 Tax=Falsiroseomonas sp. HW251 TaxID=3390998 RepID=UPI003D314636